MNNTSQKSLKDRLNSERNNNLYDVWSLVHFATGVAFGWVLSPWVAIAIMVLWEPLEILVLSPILARRGIDFGFEALRNSLSDIVVDILGVAVGYYLITSFVAPPFHLL